MLNIRLDESIREALPIVEARCVIPSRAQSKHSACLGQRAEKSRDLLVQW